MELSAEPLVGRAAELGPLEESLARSARQGFGALEISGEPEIGKTRLRSSDLVEWHRDGYGSNPFPSRAPP